MKNKINFILIYLSICYTYCEEQNFEKIMLKRLEQSIKIENKYLNRLNDLANKENLTKKTINTKGKMIPLFRIFPELKKKISYIKLGDLPTPINKCKNLEKILDIKNFYIKRDDLTGKKIRLERLFGGNKVRKLEFLLAQAIENNIKSVITFGAVGSNHALATATYCNQLGLKCYVLLKPQHNAHVVRRNLLLNLNEKSKMYFCPNDEIQKISAASIFFKNKLKHGAYPYVIPVGGSCVEGVLGYVNAAFELKDQIKSGVMKEPDYIYIALGSCGSAAGLILGLRAAGIKSKVISVSVSPEKSKNSLKNKILKLIYDTNHFLNEKDKSFPIYNFKPNDVTILTDFTGNGYGLFTQEAQKATDLLYKTEKIKLDGVYTGKTFAASLNDIKTKKEKVILFWNTFCSSDFSRKLKNLDYRKLPLCFHKYFTEDVQILDKNRQI